LLEVAIVSQRSLNLVLAHHDKRNAISKRPGLIGVPTMEAYASGKEIGKTPHYHPILRRRRYIIYGRMHFLTIAWRREAVNQLEKHVVRRYQSFFIASCHATALECSWS
jgi:hypothetical protein